MLHRDEDEATAAHLSEETFAAKHPAEEIADAADQEFAEMEQARERSLAEEAPKEKPSTPMRSIEQDLANQVYPEKPSLVLRRS